MHAKAFARHCNAPRPCYAHDQVNAPAKARRCALQPAKAFKRWNIEAVAKLSDVSQVRVFRPTGSII